MSCRSSVATFASASTFAASARDTLWLSLRFSLRLRAAARLPFCRVARPVCRLSPLQGKYPLPALKLRYVAKGAWAAPQRTS